MSAKTGFDHIAAGYDKAFTETATGRRQRAVVHHYLKNKMFSPGVEPKNREQPESGTPVSVLELNCGTGEDAVWLARHGAKVLATDIAPDMVALAAEKATQAGFDHLIRTKILDMRNLAAERFDEKFDLILSNFGGLNCLSPEELNTLGTALPALLKPGGLFVAVVMGRLCCWETLYFLLKGRWRAAFRRVAGRPVDARLDPHVTVPVWYYSPREFRRFFPALGFVTVQPVGFWLPPSYLDPLVARKPRCTEMLDFMEQKCRGRLWAWGADHFMLTVARPGGCIISKHKDMSTKLF